MKISEDGLPARAGEEELQLLGRERSAPPGIREELPAGARLSGAIEAGPRLGRVG